MLVVAPLKDSLRCESKGAGGLVLESATADYVVPPDSNIRAAFGVDSLNKGL